MPHLNIECTANLAAAADRGTLCAPLAATLVALQIDAARRYTKENTTTWRRT